MASSRVRTGLLLDLHRYPTLRFHIIGWHADELQFVDLGIAMNLPAADQCFCRTPSAESVRAEYSTGCRELQVFRYTVTAMYKGRTPQDLRSHISEQVSHTADILRPL